MARAKQDMREHVPPPLAHCAEPRRRDALLRVLFPLPIQRQTSYIKHVLMDPFSYLSVLISIILALGMTRVLAGVGEMLQARSRRRLYWVHAVWIANLFLYLVVAWWIFYRWRNQQPLCHHLSGADNCD